MRLKPRIASYFSKAVILKFILGGVLLASIAPLHAMHQERAEKGKNQKPATIKALLKKQTEGSFVEVKGAYHIKNPATGKKLSSGGRGKRYYLYPHKEGLKWGENFPGIYQIAIVPDSSKTTLLVDGIQYRGALQVYNIEGKLSIINEVDVESYLKSVLTKRFAGKLPSSVADSVAIVARTDAYYQAMVNHDSYWHVSAEDAGYLGYANTLMNFAIDRAVDNTRYLIMTYDGQPFPSTWTQNCAGKTASFQSIFRKNTTSPNGVSSSFALKDREESQWKLEIDAEELSRIAQTNRITGVDLYLDQLSGKVYAVRVKDGVHHEEIDFIALQKALGEDRLLSNDFAVTLKGNKLIFDGYGEGCGVGLCLYSAQQMAESGQIAPKILSEFYPNTHLEKMRSFPSIIVSASSDFFLAPQRGKRGGE